MNTYTIRIVNKSGAQQKYALFNQTPVVNGKVTGQIWSNVYKTTSAANAGQTSFTMYKQYYAICGSSNGSPAEGVVIDVSQTKAVTLGSVSDDGSTVPGTTFNLQVVDQTPSFDPATLKPSSFPGAFEIDTQHDFTLAEAKNFNYMIGLGSGANSGTPLASFVPQPGVQYQIQPVNTYYVSFGDYTQGALINVQAIGSKCTVDYTNPDLANTVTIIHNDHGDLVLQK